MQNEPISEQDFERAADEELHALERALTDVDGLDVDLESGILTLEFSDGVRYVINSHRAARQIWMAAERSAWHFDPVTMGATPGKPGSAPIPPVGDAPRWIAGKSGDELRATIEGVVSRKLGRPVPLG